MPLVPSIELVPLSRSALRALATGDRAQATAATPFPITSYLLEESWLWRLRLAQVEEAERQGGPAGAAAVLHWIARIVVDPQGETIGHAGFHGPPDSEGLVEVAYSVDPAFRRRGYARAMLAAVFEWARSEQLVRAVRASVSPQNVASLATIAPFDLTFVGIVDDPDDGPELVFEKQLRRSSV